MFWYAGNQEKSANCYDNSLLQNNELQQTSPVVAAAAALRALRRLETKTCKSFVRVHCSKKNSSNR
jgi:hypothetical protein